jgi:hypothetical protein
MPRRGYEDEENYDYDEDPLGLLADGGTVGMIICLLIPMRAKTKSCNFRSGWVLIGKVALKISVWFKRASGMKL